MFLHYLSVPPIDFERSAEDLEGVVIPSLTPQLEPVTIATTDSGTIGTTDPGTIATTDPVTIKTCVEPVTIATTEPVTLTNAETVATATSEPVGIPQTTTTNEETKGPEGLKIKTDAPEGDKEKTEVKDRTETPRGDQKLAVQEPIPVRRSKNFFPTVKCLNIWTFNNFALSRFQPKMSNASKRCRFDYKQ